MNGRRVFLVVCLGLAALACHGSKGARDASPKNDLGPSDGDPGSGGYGGTSGAPDSTAGGDDLDPTEVCRAAVRAHAERSATCLGQDALDYYLSSANACPGLLFNPDSNRTVDEVAACLPALRARTCTDVAAGVMPACYPHGKREGKAACAFSSQCRSDACLTNGRQCGTCAEGDKAAGEACQSWPSCAFGLHCTNSGVCAPNGTPTYAAEEEACDLDASPIKGCVGDLYCRTRGIEPKGICTAPPGAGQPCASTNMMNGVYSMTICTDGTSCVQGTCQPPGGCGNNLKCDADSICSSDTAGPVCVPRTQLGAGCPYDQGSDPCLAPARCLYNYKCGIPRVEGEACDADNPCDRFLLCVDGKCQRMNAATCPA